MSTPHSTAQKLLPLLLDNLRDYALFTTDAQSRIVTWTPGVLRVLGYEESDFIGCEASIIFTRADREHGAFERELSRATREGSAENVRWHQRKDGSLIWANGRLIALRDETGELQGFAKILRDDTAHKQVEDELERTSQRLQNALDVGRIGTWMWDIQNDQVTADANLARFFGVSLEDAAGGPLAKYTQAIHPEDLPVVSDEINDSVRRLSTFSSDYRIIQADGSLLWVEARGQISPDAHGNPAFLNGVILDISERKQVEDALRQSEERYRTLFEAIDNGFCVFEMLFDENDKPYDYRFLEINPSFERQTGLQNAVGKTALELVPDLDDSWFELYGKVAVTGEPLHFENAADAMDRIFDVHAFRVGEPEWRRVALLFTNITGRKEGEAAMREAHAKAEETNRIKDEFLATLSHELRTPLNSILGWANILRTNELDRTTQQQGLETIERNARSQSQLINDLLDVSRILTGKMHLELRAIELDDVITNAIKTVAPAAQSKGIRLDTILDHTTGFVSGDADRLSQVLWNLLTNAIKFTPRGGHITVTMMREGSQVQVHIKDSGQGIDPEFLPYVFERFRQADASSTRAFGGLGIGLALVRHLMEAHGGTVRAHSDGIDKGSTFTLSLPLAAMREAPHEVLTGVTTSIETGSSNDMTDLPELSGVKVLVVDDESDARELVALYLRQRGAKVITAENVAEALDIIGRNCDTPDKFDVLISDIGMPQQDGYHLIKQLRAMETSHNSFLPAIALTAYASPKDRIQVLLAGFQIHIPKPVEPLELLATVASLTGRTK